MKYIILSLLALICLQSTLRNVRIEKGWINLEVKTGDSSEDYKVDIASSLRETLNLTQSSLVKINSKITFSVDGFQPEFVSFRLRHQIFDNVSEPVLATWNEQQSRFNSVIDLGDPKHINHLSGEYKLEIIISDDRLEKNIRKYIAHAQINFRFSLTEPLPSELAYKQPSIIMTEVPPTRVDPPASFTGFVTLLIVILFVIFLWGLNFQKVNISLFPSSGAGLILNLIFIGSLSLILYMLFQFWLNWNFIETFQYFIIVLLPFALAANYAFVHIKKQ